MSLLKSKTILIVDDEDDLREAIKFELEMAGATVFESSSGHKAFDFLQTQSVDLVISDIRMPDGDGVELLDRIQLQSTPKPVVVLITGFSDLKPDQIYHKGASAFLGKPFDLAQFIKTAARAMLEPPVSLAEPLPHAPEQQVIIEKFSLGRGGMFISCEKTFPEVGKHVCFQIKNTSSLLKEGHGIVRWVRAIPIDNLPSGYGLEFYNLSLESIAALLSQVEKSQVKMPFIPAS